MWGNLSLKKGEFVKKPFDAERKHNFKGDIYCVKNQWQKPDFLQSIDSKS